MPVQANDRISELEAILNQLDDAQLTDYFNEVTDNKYVYARTLDKLIKYHNKLAEKYMVLVEGMRHYSQHSDIANQEVQLCRRQKLLSEEIIRKAVIARQALPLTSEENDNLYPPIENLYQQQVNRRKWHQHGLFPLAVSIIILPLTPVAYSLWKTNRNNELIQPNRISSANYATIRNARINFKRTANEHTSIENHSFIQLKPIPHTSGTPPKYVTKQKKERNNYFLCNANRFYTEAFISQQESDHIVQSKRKDTAARIESGIR